MRPGKPELRIVPRRDVLSDLKAPAVGLGMTLRANLEGIQAGTYKRDARNYDIVVKFAEEEGKDQVDEFLFPGADGHPILLANLSHVTEGEIPIQITRKNKRRISKLMSQVDRDLPLGTAVKRISLAIDEKANLPPGYAYTFAGEVEMMEEAQAGLGEAGMTAMILMILTLAAVLESFRQPALILVTLPLALIGTIWALVIVGASFSIFVIMGIVMMIGIVVNNAILIVDQFNIHVAEGVPRHKAMVAGACERFRPIVMITLAAVLGDDAFGPGAGSRRRDAKWCRCCLCRWDLCLGCAHTNRATDSVQSIHKAREASLLNWASLGSLGMHQTRGVSVLCRQRTRAGKSLTSVAT